MPLPFDEEPYDEAHFIALLKRALPDDYFSALEINPNSGFELIQALAAVGARMSLAVNRVEQGNLALYAEGGSKAIVQVVFRRPDNSAGDFIIQAGTVVETAVGGRRFMLQTNLLMSGVTLEVTGSCQAVATGWEYNVLGQRTTAGGETLPGEVSVIPSLRTSPPYAEPRLTVEQILPATGGAAAMLDMLAEDKLIRRGPTEGDAQLSYRVRTLPDTVSPGAVLRLLHSVLDPFGMPFDFIETFEHRYQECYDAPSPNVGTPSYQATPPLNPDFDQETFVYDDPRPADPVRNMLLGDDDYRAAFVVVLRKDVTLRDTGFAYDDPGMAPADFHPVIGRPWRQTPAYDTSSADPPGLVFGPAYDGFDIGRGALYASLVRQLDAIRAAGVNFFVIGVVG